jgi:hypothetical protein
VERKAHLLLAGCVLATLIIFLVPHISKGQAQEVGAQTEALAARLENAGWELLLRPGGQDGSIPEVVVGRQVVIRMRCSAGGFTPWERAQLVLERLARAARQGIDPACIVPGFAGGEAVVRAGDMLLVTADRATARANSLSPPELALVWANNLRTSLGARALEREEAFRAMARGRTLTARASWYGPRFHGRRTANGEVFNQNLFTAAHRTLPFGTLVLVTNPATGRSVLVRINDRGPYIRGRSIDLSRAAARAIGMEEAGVAEVELAIVGR